MGLKDILQDQGKKKKKKKCETSLRVNVIEIIGSFTIVRDEDCFAILKIDSKVMKHLEEQKGLLIPRPRLDSDGCLSLTTLQPCKIPRMPLDDTEEDKKTIESFRKKIEQLNREDDDNLSFEEISEKNIKKIEKISLYVAHVGKECEGHYGSFRCLFVVDKEGKKATLYLNHLQLLDSLNEAPGTFTFANIESSKKDDIKLKTTAKTTIEENKDVNFESVQVGAHLLEAPLYHFEEPKLYDNGDWKVTLLFTKQEDLDVDKDKDEKIGNVAKKLKLDDDIAESNDDEDDSDDNEEDESDDDQGETDKDDNDDIIKISASLKGLKSVKDIRDLKDVNQENLTLVLLTLIGKRAKVDYNVFGAGGNYVQRIRFV